MDNWDSCTAQLNHMSLDADNLESGAAHLGAHLDAADSDEGVSVVLVDFVTAMVRPSGKGFCQLESINDRISSTVVAWTNSCMSKRSAET